MVIEYICNNDSCGYTFCDVVILPKCKCPKCDSPTEHYEWEGLGDA
jgi:predicted Zn-ribbon and HTH transcriptional regulator